MSTTMKIYPPYPFNPENPVRIANFFGGQGLTVMEWGRGPDKYITVTVAENLSGLQKTTLSTAITTAQRSIFFEGDLDF